jgi:hypothetical protein
VITYWQFWQGNSDGSFRFAGRGRVPRQNHPHTVGAEYTSRDLWQEVKSLVREYESEEACLIFDDTIVSKAYTDENDLICWHWDHSKGCNEKGINLLTAFYHTQLPSASEALRVPVIFECVKKTVRFCEVQTRKEKRQSTVTKNEMMRQMLQRTVKEQHLKFRYVLADSWFSSSDNLLFIHRLKKYFVMDMKSNRLCLFSTQDRNRGGWRSLDKLPLQSGQPVKVWIKDLEIEVLLCKFVFTNKDGSTGEMYLISNDLTLSTEYDTTEFYVNALKDGRQLLKEIFTSDADFIPDFQNNILTVRLHSLSTPRANRVVKKLCDDLNKIPCFFPFTNLKLFYDSLAF